ncbi:MAG: hypothetical protein H7144_08820 [Burkholderiales bacterium]|nr:hypothetical protein [Phycisphaerae bacterium]
MTQSEFEKQLESLPAVGEIEQYETAIYALAQRVTTAQRKHLFGLLRGRPESLRLTPEQRISRAVRRSTMRINIGETFSDLHELNHIATGFEYFLPPLLAEKYPHWKHESFDGMFFLPIRKTGDLEAELYGMSILISDQTLTPIHMHLKCSDQPDKIDRMECRVGARGEGTGQMQRIPWAEWRHEPLAKLPPSYNEVDWVVYGIIYGARPVGT